MFLSTKLMSFCAPFLLRVKIFILVSRRVLKWLVLRLGLSSDCSRDEMTSCQLKTSTDLYGGMWERRSPSLTLTHPLSPSLTLTLSHAPSPPLSLSFIEPYYSDARKLNNIVTIIKLSKQLAIEKESNSSPITDRKVSGLQLTTLLNCLFLVYFLDKK